MNFIQSVKTCFKKFAVFKGRATRSEFWWFQLFFWLALFGTVLILGLSGYVVTDEVWDIALIGEMILFIPVLTVTARRLHDMGLSGWLQAPVVLTYLEDVDIVIPDFSDIVIVQYVNNASMIFFVAILLICIRRGQSKANKYGPDPLAPNLDKVFN